MKTVAISVSTEISHGFRLRGIGGGVAGQSGVGGERRDIGGGGQRWWEGGGADGVGGGGERRDG
ncbi:hypothetical protein A2U01_0078422, partial [Trifolium medium]|nr:hypothetical protein [Trifolium medium]